MSSSRPVEGIRKRAVDSSIPWTAWATRFPSQGLFDRESFGGNGSSQVVVFQAPSHPRPLVASIEDQELITKGENRILS